MWYTDENAFIRQKMTAESLKESARLLEPIIRQWFVAVKLETAAE